jgi:hypothetical protein
MQKEYKTYGQEKFNLLSQDFLFGFMNEEMELKRYGKNIICMDGMYHGTNHPYKYEQC